MNKKFYLSNVVFFTAVAVFFFCFSVAVYGAAYATDGIDLVPQMSIVPNLFGTIVMFLLVFSFGFIFNAIARWKDQYLPSWMVQVN